MEDPQFVKSEVKIPSKTPGWDLDAWKFLPMTASGSSSRPLPVISADISDRAHGISANKRMGLSLFAERFASLGYAVVVFDYRRWGTSAGTPRHIVFVSEQLDDYRTVVKYVRQQAEFDPQKVVLWGTSFSGGHVTALSSEKNLNLTAVIAQCPFLGLGSGSSRLTKALLKTVLAGIHDILRQTFGMTPRYMPAVAQPGQVGLLTAPGSVEGMNLILPAEEGVYPNEVSASSLFELPFYNPRASGARITCPVLLVAAEQDNLCPLGFFHELKGLSPKVQLVSFPLGHFELYNEKGSMEAMVSFLEEHVPLDGSAPKSD
ncbi:alpha/beta-hydrolase [Epithele typhae]|uniref:alpha/beta-hydrolase n=1 Tax=Epithele typhae TaxID=378194 RepID=UPI00200759B2|nr:alpha/beta-hydrolase [Epithele typhae]KAH9945399.1 alpha/beta-hydrolase [Epithele typhae]